MENITIRRINIGKIGGTPWMYPTSSGSVFLIGLTYGDIKNQSQHRSGSPLFRNVTFEDISVVSAGVAGHIQGLPEICLQGLTLRNISIHGGNAKWICNNVDLETLTTEQVFPHLSCTSGCNSSTSFTNSPLVSLQYS